MNEKKSENKREDIFDDIFLFKNAEKLTSFLTTVPLNS